MFVVDTNIDVSTIIVKQSDAVFDYRDDANSLVYQSSDRLLTIDVIYHDADKYPINNRYSQRFTITLQS